MTEPRRVRVQGDLFHGRVPDGAIYVGRGAPGLRRSTYANPHNASPKGCPLCGGRIHDAAEAVALYTQHLADHPELAEQSRHELRGRDLACWCRDGDPCHVDPLLAVANSTETRSI